MGQHKGGVYLVDLMEYISMALFLLSTPVAWFAIKSGYNESVVAVANSYAFSLGMIGLYVAPFLFGKSWAARLHRATSNWVIFSAITQVVFQVPHNLFPAWIDSKKGEIWQWPFVGYAVCDSRWKQFNPIPAEVWLINANDASLGLLVVFTYFIAKVWPSDRREVAHVIAVVFRDATLWRETLEYMMDHHRSDYKHTLRATDGLVGHDHGDLSLVAGGITGTPHEHLGIDLHVHAKTCLWLVNILWLIAPVLTIEWAIHRYERRSVRGEWI